MELHKWVICGKIVKNLCNITAKMGKISLKLTNTILNIIKIWNSNKKNKIIKKSKQILINYNNSKMLIKPLLLKNNKKNR